jgi:hypothetical protein
MNVLGDRIGNAASIYTAHCPIRLICVTRKRFENGALPHSITNLGALEADREDPSRSHLLLDSWFRLWSSSV